MIALSVALAYEWAVKSTVGKGFIMLSFLTRKRFFLFFALAACLLAGAVPATADAFRVLEPGLSLAVISYHTELGSSEELVLLRADPAMVDLDLLISSELGIAPLTPQAWAENYGLSAVINASMYLDNVNTSTGYMRHNGFLNNPRVVTRFGAFFVSGPVAGAKNTELPAAAVLDRDADDWERLLPLYNTVVQNFRIINAQGVVLWTDNNRRHSISALGEDEDGLLYFIHTPGMVSVPELVRLLYGLPIIFTRLMYVEGGHPAALHVQTSRLTRTWAGRYANFISDPAAASPLPNVIVIRRKSASWR